MCVILFPAEQCELLHMQVDKHQRKRKAEDSPEGGPRGRMQRPYPSPHAMDWAHRPAPISNYEMAQRAQHGRAAHQGLSSPNGKSRSPQSHNKVWASMGLADMHRRIRPGSSHPAQHEELFTH